MRFSILFLTLASLLGAMAWAEPPEPVPVPHGLPEPVTQKLASERAKLLKMEEKLDGEVDAHNLKCRNVPKGSALADECRREQDTLERDIATYTQAVEAYNDRVGGIAGVKLLQLARDLLPDPVPAKYAYRKGQTHCSEFVRDFAMKWAGGKPVDELSGQAGSQIDAMAASSHIAGGGWHEISFLGDTDDQEDAFQKAVNEARQGKLVVVGFKEDPPTPSNTGHVAIVLPIAIERAGDKTLSGAPGWAMKVPHIAQAGNTVKPDVKLSSGFSPDHKKAMRIFVLDAPPGPGRP